MSSKNTATKLQVKDQNAVFVAASEVDVAEILGILPTGASLVGAADGADVAVLFARNSGELARVLAGTLPTLTAVRAVWICYPKGNKADINRTTIWQSVRDVGWDLVSNVSMDDTWSALRAKPLAP
jgi:hypothetical protein